ncbi:P-loop containing nucleoside triphosphate hydrolase protein [Exidia glandulosa HHB12029]|uniref:RNA helicase n=1 Tax=Exidia glandulosa HHB12029 TaxID=1314781 RepID=A0A166B889_EXIGL|nr:P-loop containing nucleoside triphosphate hydrolase protein [Exidia glandulosa HHB12029]
MPPHRPERYNAKARASVPGGSGHKKRKRGASVKEPEADPNAEILAAEPASVQDARKAQLRDELLASTESKMSSKKKKRLEGYINKKLKKEERIELFDKLAATQAQIPNTTRLQASASLGTGRTQTHEEDHARQEHKEVKQALAKTKLDIAPATGSALKRNADGSVVQPRILQRKKKKQPNIEVALPESSDESMEDDGDEDDDASDNASEQEDDDDGDANSGSDSGSESPSDSDASSESLPEPKKKSLGFKDWALKQLDVSRGGASLPTTPAEPNAETDDIPQPPPKRRKVEHVPGDVVGPMGEKLQLPKTAFAELQTKGTTRHVEVTRDPVIQAARLELPVVAEEQPIMETILLNPVTVLCGETDNPGMIGITQPRRVAAMSMAARVANELSLPTNKVSYQIRYDATVSPSTVIKFMTDGVLLREMNADFLLNKYSVIVVDEAHERSINTDILIGALSRVVRLREDMWKAGKGGTKPLRLVIMSATLRVTDFTDNRVLFPAPPPVINIEARQYPVTVHFSRRTTPDYVTEAISKTCKIHTRLPPGGVLVFLTGQNEITAVCRKLEAKFGRRAVDAQAAAATTKRLSAMQGDVEAEEIELDISPEDLEDDDGDIDAESDDELDMQGFDEPIAPGDAITAMHVVPLYSLLPAEKQMQVFSEPPAGTRLVVVATNVAETSITIPGIRYVVDCGRAKQRHYDTTTGIQSFRVSWVSKASASQRAGRAGRTGPGHCYRLYSSALFENQLDDFAQPEILRMPIEGVVLQMKSMHIDAVVNFPFPTPPDRPALKRAESLLQHLGALEPPSAMLSVRGTSPAITDLGKAMAMFPISPRLAKMLVTGRQHGCLPYVIALVAALSVGDPFLRDEVQNDKVDAADVDSDDAAPELATMTSEEQRQKELRKARRRAFFKAQEMHSKLGRGQSDMFRLLSVVGAYEFSGGGQKFCSENFVRLKTMEEIHKLRAQLTSMVQANFSDTAAAFAPQLQPPNANQLKVLRQLITAGFINQVAVRKDVIQVATGNKFATAINVPYRAFDKDEDVFVHPSSVLASQPPPDFVVFQDIVRSSKPFMKNLTVVNPAWLPSLGPSLCTFSKALQGPTSFKDVAADEEIVIPRFGIWQLPAIKRKKP